MIYTIQSELLQVSITKKGMELCSIKNRIDETEYLWQRGPFFLDWAGAYFISNHWFTKG